MAGFVLWVLLIGGLLAAADWERHGRPVPHIPELELPVHGLTALVVGLLLSAIAIAIVVLDIALVSLTRQ